MFTALVSLFGRFVNFISFSRHFKIFSWGTLPYINLTNDEVLKRVCDPGCIAKLPKPDDCPEKLYDLMLRCWNFNPELRPSFKEVLEVVESMTSKQKKIEEEEISNADYLNTEGSKKDLSYTIPSYANSSTQKPKADETYGLSPM